MSEGSHKLGMQFSGRLTTRTCEDHGLQLPMGVEGRPHCLSIAGFSVDCFLIIMLESVKRPSLTKTTETSIAENRKRFFIIPTCWGPSSQDAGQRKDPEERKNTLFMPL